jgi:hypothetical protein
MFNLHYREILGHASYIFCTSFLSTPARSALSEGQSLFSSESFCGKSLLMRGLRHQHAAFLR